MTFRTRLRLFTHRDFGWSCQEVEKNLFVIQSRASRVNQVRIEIQWNRFLFTWSWHFKTRFVFSFKCSNFQHNRRSKPKVTKKAFVKVKETPKSIKTQNFALQTKEEEEKHQNDYKWNENGTAGVFGFCLCFGSESASMSSAAQKKIWLANMEIPRFFQAKMLKLAPQTHLSRTTYDVLKTRRRTRAKMSKINTKTSETFFLFLFLLRGHRELRFRRRNENFSKFSLRRGIFCYSTDQGWSFILSFYGATCREWTLLKISLPRSSLKGNFFMSQLGVCLSVVTFVVKRFALHTKITLLGASKCFAYRSRVGRDGWSWWVRTGVWHPWAFLD